MNLRTTGHKRQTVCLAAIFVLMEEKFNFIIFVFKGAGCEVNPLNEEKGDPIRY